MIFAHLGKSLIAGLFFLTLLGCSIYRSNGRKQFEGNSPGKLQAQSAGIEKQNCYRPPSYSFVAICLQQGGPL